MKKQLLYVVSTCGEDLVSESKIFFSKKDAIQHIVNYACEDIDMCDTFYDDENCTYFTDSKWEGDIYATVVTFIDGKDMEHEEIDLVKEAYDEVYDYMADGYQGGKLWAQHYESCRQTLQGIRAMGKVSTFFWQLAALTSFACVMLVVFYMWLMQDGIGGVCEPEWCADSEQEVRYLVSNM